MLMNDTVQEYQILIRILGVELILKRPKKQIPFKDTQIIDDGKICEGIALNTNRYA